MAEDSSSGLDLSSIIKGASDIANAGVNFYKGVTSSPNTTAAKAASASTVGGTSAGVVPAWKTYLPYILGGVGLLVVVGLIFRRK